MKGCILKMTDDMELAELKESLNSDDVEKEVATDEIGTNTGVLSPENESDVHEPDVSSESVEASEEDVIRTHEYYLNQYRKNFESLTVYLTNGKFINGRIVGFDKFTIMLKNKLGIHMLFKGTICNISPYVKKEEQEGGKSFSKGGGYNNQRSGGYSKPSFKKPSYKKFER